MEKFSKILSENVVDLEALKKICWTGKRTGERERGEGEG